jgi:DNA-binding CsgD family transcriptional regulator/PAS domain-containing protein
MGKGNKSPPPTNELIGEIYDAALDPALWPTAVASMRTYLRTTAAALFVQDFQRMESSSAVVDGWPEEAIAEYGSYFAGLDPNAKAVTRLAAPVGTSVATNLIIPDREFENTEYYWDFFRRFDVFSAAGVVVECSNDVMALFAVQRPRRMSGFSKEDLRRIDGLFPPLRRALMMGRRLQLAESDRRAALATLDRLAAGVILIDAHGQTVHANAAAQAMLRQRDGLSLVNRQMIGATPDATARLAKVIGEAAGTFTNGTGSSGGALALARPSGKGSYLVTVSPLAPENPLTDGPRRVAAIVFIDDPDAAVRTPPEELKALFGLTTAEAKVALAWANGERAENICDAHGTKLETVRSQIRSIHDKLGVSRQAQASKRIVKATALVRREED